MHQPTWPVVAFIAFATYSPGLLAVEIDFNRDVRPILSNKCFSCHGPDANQREADLRLDDEGSAKADLGGYHAIAAGDPDNSELIARITSTDADTVMPPPDAGDGKRLTETQVALLTAWIAEGANWENHWAYVRPVRHETPEVSAHASSADGPIANGPIANGPSANWIDAFVLVNLKQRGVQPAPLAAPIPLIRRIHFDLVGLPPTPEFVDQFSAQLASTATRQQSYEQLVDQLLESPHFGERLAMYWLDLVRYADTVGYHGDQDQNISPYRDYVIDAFNRNLPFDQFTREQLAGDLLPNPNEDQIVATGYNRLLQTSHEGGVQPKEYLAIYAADRVRNVSMVWLGGTLGCAQCHDHKYDPYSAKDFYAMSAFFADIDDAKHFKVGTNALPTSRPPEISVLNRRDREEANQLRGRLKTLKAEAKVAHETKRAAFAAEVTEISGKLQSFAVNKRLTMVTVALDTPRPTRLLPRGNWLDESGPVVQPDVPNFLGSVSSSNQRATRLDFANWLTDAEHGYGLLASRVFVNRVWYLFFGEGLARNLDDFGGQGLAPDHPQLLDRLAVEFVENGWNIKWLVKQIVTSRTYQQTSRRSDPSNDKNEVTDVDNRWLSRQRSFRLPAEMIRDTALAVSGLLVDDVGGHSIRPYQPTGYYRHLNFPQRRYQHDAGRQQWRRGVYVHWQRQFLHPTLRALDAPSREECTARRAKSNTPLAALALLNDPTFVEAARMFAQRLLLEMPDSTFDQRLNRAFKLALSRPADEFETTQLRALFDRELEEFARKPVNAESLLSVGQADSDATLSPVELAAWTAVTRTILNLHETITRD